VASSEDFDDMVGWVMESIDDDQHELALAVIEEIKAGRFEVVDDDGEGEGFDVKVTITYTTPMLPGDRELVMNCLPQE
jgi:hypothetical protein